MISRVASIWGVCIVAVLIAARVYAQAPSDFASEPDKSMASAHESFLKGDMNKAADHIKKATAYVRTQEKKVAKDASKGVKKAGDDLEKLGADVKKGVVKSPDQLKKTFAQVDHALATAWHATAAQEQKAGKDATGALKSAGAGLQGAATWTGTKLNEGAQAAVDTLSKAGGGVKLGAESVGNAFRGLGEGIADLGRKISG
jgi:hypothetical protein